MMILRIYIEKLGGHYHTRVFMGKHEGALGKCGDLCFREEEWPLFVNALDAGQRNGGIKLSIRQEPRGAKNVEI